MPLNSLAALLLIARFYWSNNLSETKEQSYPPKINGKSPKTMRTGVHAALFPN